MKDELTCVWWNVNYIKFGQNNAYVLNALQGLGTFDVICLQEYVDGADTTFKDWLKANDYQVSYLPFSYIDTLSQGVMVAIKQHLKPVMTTHMLRRDKPVKKRPFPNTRGLIAARLTVNNQTFTILNIHLTYPRLHTTTMRKNEFRALVTLLETDLKQQNWLLGGDFNFFGKDGRKKYLLARFEHFSGGAFALKTWRHLAKYSPLRANLDYLFWNTPQLKPNAHLGAFYDSDHRPIIATIQVPPATSSAKK